MCLVFRDKEICLTNYIHIYVYIYILYIYTYKVVVSSQWKIILDRWILSTIGSG